MSATRNAILAGLCAAVLASPAAARETREAATVSPTTTAQMRAAVAEAAARRAAPAPAAARDLAPHQRLGAPYRREGVWYMPAHEPAFDETGVAGVMARELNGRSTANGETIALTALTAAHPTLPLPSLMEVTNVQTGQTVTVRLNDRGPFVADRMLDLSPAAAQRIGLRPGATATVRARYLGPAAPADARPAPVLVAEAPARDRGAAAFVQAGAFSSEANAERARRAVADLGPARIVERRSDGRSLFRVLLGPVSDRSEAQAKAQKLASLGLPGAMVVAD